MRLLICTQAVDRNDPALGFFHQWLQEFARHFERIHVVCLKEGEHALPANVFVHSLGKEKGRSLIKYTFYFYSYIWSFRKDYDAVFVHMNQEYVLLAFKLWWVLRKRIVLWRNHKNGSLLTLIAAFLSHTVCHTSPVAYVAGFRNAVRMPIGIDTDVFKPNGNADPSSILFLGRLDPVKRPEMLLQALEILMKKGVVFTADIVGDPTPGREAFARELKERYSSMPNVAFKPAIRNDRAVVAYISHGTYVNLTPSGSFDKTIGEAMACGCVVVAANDVLRGVLPEELLVDPESAQSVARGIEEALGMDEASREHLRARAREYVEREHSLSLLASKLAALYKS